MCVPSDRRDPGENPGFLLGGVEPNNVVAVLNERLLQMEHLIVDDQESVDAMQRLRDTLSAQDSYNWILLVLIIATIHWHPNDPPMVQLVPGRLSIIRAVRMLIGRRGIVHGWSSKMPNIINALQNHGNSSLVLWSHDCAIDHDTDGNSSFNSDSVGYGDGSWKSGPRGVAIGRPPVTSSLSECSVATSGDDVPVDQPNVTDNPGGIAHQLTTRQALDDSDDRSKYKKFYKYMEQSAAERRERRAMRRARREMRCHGDKQQRMDKSLFDMEARRTQLLTAESLRNELRVREPLNAEQKMERVLHWCQTQQNVMAATDCVFPPSDDLINCRLKDLRRRLCKEVSDTWSKFYGDQLLVKAPPGEMEQLVFHSWITPVRWVQQTGPK